MGSTELELRLKFLFANQDGVRVELGFPKEATVAEVKAQLIRSWPQNVPVAEDAKSVRLICMGRGILQDTHTLSSAVPAFDTHPTPVNVSVFHKSQQAVREPTRGHTAAKTVESAGCGCVIC
ncbi:Ubiquitin-2 like Rad60 SUMO-like [Phytophthora infestans]|uniref:Ubiquitin-2 like Rad60 SUMO-like n=1 Tax=Phytophthora infestans TaxID=4787 RepID=A0A8S9TRP6_PHYIN|nr:Ubiquitin-2 like Rad60 SUMO-like [Phytophthora infestans]